jgi:NAD/NADP transhydrogenase alpha subunit
MKIGCLKEIKTHEYRVGLTPSDVKSYISRGHKVIIQQGAGEEAGFTDGEYLASGAFIESDRKKIFDTCEMIIKVKEPLPEEYNLFHKDQLLYTYLHLAADSVLTEAMLKAGIRGVAYETIELADGQLPCLQPMSEIAGRLAVQEGAKLYCWAVFQVLKEARWVSSVAGWWEPMPAKLPPVWAPRSPFWMSVPRNYPTSTIFSAHALPRYIAPTPTSKRC